MANILHVDDDDAVRAMLSAALTNAGHQVQEAASGQKGLSAYEKTSIDLVITDLVMPDTDGFQLMREIRLVSPEVKIIVISGEDRLGALLTMAKMLGARRVLAKPFSGQELLEAVDEVLEAK